jgi:spermidine synthase
MAVIWTKTANGARFEVRRAGHSIRLYTNGVFHSQYNPSRPIAANVWNLLLLPAFFRPAGSIGRALVLGVGGGAVIRLLHDFVRPQQTIGVELDPTHLYIARRFFGVTRDRASLVNADAADWLSRYRGPKFDLVIDDLFGETDGEPVRSVEADAVWLAKLSRSLAGDGVLVMNFVSNSALRDASRTLQRIAPQRFANAFRLSLPGYENAIGAFLAQPSAARQLRRMLRIADVRGATGLSRLPYRIERISPHSTS